ncbi:MAG: hypothetical protein H0T92_06845 [Pyrinomonadaceae bacterium]|nr:hypothetical protein [Pyrinomonadaceae bacterium]
MKLLLITVATVRHQLRWAAQHIYSLLFLSPLVLGITYATLARLVGDASAEWQPSLALSVALAWFLEASVIALSMSRASREIYHLRQPESFLEALPVARATHLHAALVTRLARTMLVGTVVLVARSLLNQGDLPFAHGLLPLSLFILITALTQMLAALNWIHWGHTRDKPVTFGISLVLLLAVSIAGLLLLLIVAPRMLPVQVPTWLLISGSLLTVALYSLARGVHGRWRVFDIEHVRRLQTINQWSVFRAGLTGLLHRRGIDRAVAAQLARDLQLTIRTFSSAVYVAAGTAALWLIVLLTVLITDLLPEGQNSPFDVGSDWLSNTWLPPVMATKFACVFAVASLAALLPILVAYQIPYFWLERAAGTTAERMWEAKMWYTRLVSMPVPFAAWLIGWASGEVPFVYSLPLLFECLWLWWLVSSLIGLLCFEMPAQPGLAIILMMTLGLGFGLLVALAWPIGLSLYAFGFAQMIERGHARAHYFITTGGD